MTRDLPAEFRLVAACCMWPPSERRNAAIRAAAAGAIDWSRFLQVVKRQRVAGLAQNGLSGAGIVLASNIESALSAAAGDVARQNLFRASEAMRLQGLFDSAQIPTVFVKGTALALLAYGSLAVKEAFDIDVLVASEQALQACAVLRQAGYTRVLPAGNVEDERFGAWVQFAHECAFQHLGHRTMLDLHWRLSDNPAMLAKVTARSQTQAVPISPGRSLRTLRDEDLFAYLCLHGALHGWSRIKWLADLSAWLAAKPADEVTRLYRAARSAGIGRAPDQALLLCERLLDLRLSPELRGEIRADLPTRWLVSIALDAMAGAGAIRPTEERPISHIMIVFSHLLLAPSLSSLSAVLRQNSVGWSDYSRIVLPRSLFFLYPLLRVPSWLWRQMSALFARG